MQIVTMFHLSWIGLSSTVINSTWRSQCGTDKTKTLAVILHGYSGGEAFIANFYKNPGPLPPLQPWSITASVYKNPKQSMATHCSVLMWFRRTWWRSSIFLVCFGWTWGRSIPLTLMWFTALKQFGGQQDIISWELLWGYRRRRGAFSIRWTVRKGCHIHLDWGSAWRDNNRLEWTHPCILRHNKFVWNRDITSHWCMKMTSWQHLPFVTYLEQQ